MPLRIGHGVLVVSALGYPLTQAVIRRFGRRGAVVVEAACVGLLVRDVVLIAIGTPQVLRPGPAALLWLEAVAAAAASATTARLVLDEETCEAASGRPIGHEARRRGAVATLFGLHTVRFWIYLQPDQGLGTA